MTLIIGLTGGIASGKSTVAAMFKELNIPVIDADVIAREVVEPGEDAYEAILQQFGTDILADDQKNINRKKLGDVIFTNEEKRKQLNEIVHPAVRKRMLEQRDQCVQQGVPCVVLDIPLLFESKLTHFVDRIVVVAVTESVQLQRLQERNGFTEEEAKNRINAQMPLQDKVKLADAVLQNDGTINETKTQLLHLLKQWEVNH
ncbi:dephospho-CoA kinase [Ornithinibacillus gellani]|uniref:dephospho-CoA kinase n=1 Tax=Ornithinibacillus gellani TaxID=2293253 RepID=UPI000F49CA91|nr:dephospho-CoA kinase [Ornithinibacillus gellani]TQS76237.1 dephospho-CoA kinase [Ornithinibacillus gellani]